MDQAAPKKICYTSLLYKELSVAVVEQIMGVARR